MGTLKRKFYSRLAVFLTAVFLTTACDSSGFNLAQFIIESIQAGAGYVEITYQPLEDSANIDQIIVNYGPRVGEMNQTLTFDYPWVNNKMRISRLTAGQSYCFSIRGFNAEAEKLGPGSNVLCTTVLETDETGAPTMIAFTSGNSIIAYVENPRADTQYQFCFKETGRESCFQEPMTNSLPVIFDNLTDSVSYSLSVRSYRDEVYSDYSPELEIVITGDEPLAAPGCTITGGEEQITISNCSQIVGNDGETATLYVTIETPSERLMAFVIPESGEIVIPNLTETGTYQVRAFAIDSNGNQGGVTSASVEVTVLGDLLTAPNIRVYVISNDSVLVSWSAVTGDYPAAHYELNYSNEDQEFSRIITDRTYVYLRGLPSGTYTFEGWAVDTRGRLGESRVVEDVVVGTGQSLAAPVIIATTVDEDIMVNWNSVLEATGYTVYVCTETGQATDDCLDFDETDTNITLTTIDGIELDTEYFVRVRATNADATSALSNEETVTPSSTGTGLTVPGNPTFTGGVLNLTGSWEEVDGAADYLVEVTDTTFGLFFVETGLTLDRALQPAGTYHVTVRARNALGQSGLPTEAIEVVVTDTPVTLDAPVLVASADGEEIEVAVAPVTGATSYTVYVCTSSNQAIGDCLDFETTTGLLTLTTANGISLDTQYFIRAVATDGVNVSGYSNEETVTASSSGSGLAAPTNVVLSGDVLSITGSWDAVTDAVSYIFEASGPVNYSWAVSSTNVTLAVTESGTYSVTIRGRNAAGQLGPASTVQDVVVTAAPIATPTLVAVASGENIEARVTPITGATSYSIFVCTASGQDVSTCNEQTIAAPETEITLTSAEGITPDTTYYLRAQATDGSGVSGLSNEEVVTPTSTGPGLEAPANASFTGGEFELSGDWDEVTGANDYVVDALGPVDFSWVTGALSGVWVVPSAGTYSVTVRARNSAGQVGPTSTAQNVVVDEFPIAAPTLVAVASGENIDARVSAVTGATGYTFYLCTSSGQDVTTCDPFTTAAPDTDITLTSAEGVVADTTYYIVAEATDGVDTSDLSNEEVVTPTSSGPGFDAPENVNFTGGELVLNGTWDALTGAARYVVAAQNGPQVYSQSVTDTTIAMPVPSGGTYSVTVRGVTATGLAGPASTSQDVIVQDAPISAPTLVAVAPGEDIEVRVSVVSGATGYSIYVCTTTGQDVTTCDEYTLTAPETGLTLTDTDGIIPGTTYYLVATATDGSQTSELSNEEVVTPTQISSGLEAPANAQFVGGVLQVSGSWDPDSADHYIMYAQADVDTYSRTITGTSGTLPVPVAGVYSVWVRGVNAEGQAGPITTPVDVAVSPYVAPDLPVPGLSVEAVGNNSGVGYVNFAITPGTDEATYGIIGHEICYDTSYTGDPNDFLYCFDADGQVNVTVDYLDGLQTYYFCALGYTLEGRRSSCSTVQQVFVMSRINTPTITLTAGSQNVRVDWSIPDPEMSLDQFISEYHIYVYSDAAGTQLLSTATVTDPLATSHTVASLTNGNTYYFAVGAVNSLRNNEEVVSAISSATPRQNLPNVNSPAVQATSDTTARVTWIAPPGETRTYTVQTRWTGGVTELSFTAPNTSTSLDATGLDNKVTYTVEIRTVNTAGYLESGWTTVGTVRPLMPAPLNPSATATWDTALVNYTHPDDNRVEGYTLYCSDGVNPEFSSSIGYVESYTLSTGLVWSTTYTCYLRSRSVSLGEGVPSANFQFTTWNQLVGATGLAGTSGDSVVNISWTRSADGRAGNEWVCWGLDLGSLTCQNVGQLTNWQVSGLINGQTYNFLIRTFSSDGLVSADSSVVQAMPYQTPAQATGLTVIKGDNTAILNWIDNSDATITFYQFSRSLTPGQHTSWGNLGLVFTYTDVGPTLDQTNYYVVRGCYTLGGQTICGPWSNEVSLLAGPIILPPTLNDVLAGDGQVTVQYTHNPAETRADSAIVYCSPFSPPTDAINTSNTTVDITATNGQVYYCMVETCDAAMHCSVPSIQKQAKPEAGNPAPDAPTGLGYVLDPDDETQILITWTNDTVSDFEGTFIYWGDDCLNLNNRYNVGEDEFYRLPVLDEGAYCISLRSKDDTNHLSDWSDEITINFPFPGIWMYNFRSNRSTLLLALDIPDSLIIPGGATAPERADITRVCWASNDFSGYYGWPESPSYNWTDGCQAFDPAEGYQQIDDLIYDVSYHRGRPFVTTATGFFYVDLSAIRDPIGVLDATLTQVEWLVAGNDPSLPAAPSTASVNSTTAGLISWTANPSAEAYLVSWRRGTGDWEMIPERVEGNTSYQIPNLTSGTWWYSMAYVINGEITGFSTPQSFVAP